MKKLYYGGTILTMDPAHPTATTLLTEDEIKDIRVLCTIKEDRVLYRR